MEFLGVLKERYKFKNNDETYLALELFTSTIENRFGYMDEMALILGTITYHWNEGNLVPGKSLDEYPDIPEEDYGKYRGGFKSSVSNSYVKTNRKYKGKDGVEKILYKKNDIFYIKKKSVKTGKMIYHKVKA